MTPTLFFSFTTFLGVKKAEIHAGFNSLEINGKK
jgi:hypothetical protein